MVTTLARPYVAVFVARFLMMLQYRAAAFAGLVTQFWFGAILIMVLAAFYAGGHGNPALSLAQAVTYTWLGQAFLGLLPWNVDPEIATMMRSGNVAYERLRPVDTFAYWLARAAARRASSTLLRAVPLLLVAMLVLPAVGLDAWSLQPPPGVTALALFVLSMAAALALSAALSTLLDISVLWTISGNGIVVLTNSLVIILAGYIIPLPLFPDWAQTFLFLQPLAGLADLPFRIYTGDLTGWRALAGLALQVAWTGVAVAAGRVLMERAMRRVEVQGG